MDSDDLGLVPGEILAMCDEGMKIIEDGKGTREAVAKGLAKAFEAGYAMCEWDTMKVLRRKATGR